MKPALRRWQFRLTCGLISS